MKIEDLLAKLEENASVSMKPVAVTVPGLGTVHVRRRTVLEFEQMSSFKLAEMGTANNGMFAPALVRLLCDEDGVRFPKEYEASLAQLLAQQPEEVFHALIDASDGKAPSEPAKVEEPAAEGAVKVEGEPTVPN